MAKRKPDHSAVIYLIAIFKLIKGLLLVGIGIGAFSMRNKNLNDTISHWANSMGVAESNKYLNMLLEHTLNISKKKLELVSAATFIYAAMFLTEGTGLFLGRRWAEYMAIITTAGLMPLEIYEICVHPSGLKIATLVLNALAVVYLIVRVWSTREGKEDHSRSAQNAPAAA